MNNFIYFFSMVLPSFGFSQAVQAPEPRLLAPGEHAPKQVSPIEVVMPPACDHKKFMPFKTCRRDAHLEWRLEQEYWYLIGSVNGEGMATWLRKTGHYLGLSRSHEQGRLHMLRVFGNLFVYASGNIFNPLRSPYVLSALRASERSTQLMPRSPNAWAFYYAIRNFIHFSTGQKQEGMGSIASLMMLEDQFDEWGYAGTLGAIVHLLGAADPDLVRTGLKFYQDCLDRECERRTSIAPYQKIGALLTAAEARAYLGDEEGMDRDLAQAKKLSDQQGYPMADAVVGLRHELIREGGLVDQWRGGKRLGEFRWPLGPAHSPIACALCHVGAQVPRHYYHLSSRTLDERLEFK